MFSKIPRLPKNNGLLVSLVILLITIVITFVTIDMTFNKSTIIKSSSTVLVGNRRKGECGKIYEIMESDNRRILSSGFGRGRGNSSTIEILNGTDLTLWSTDFHISPIADIKSILHKVNQEVGRDVIKVIDKSLSGHCHLTNTCAGNDLKILTKENGIDLAPCPNKLRREFFTYYSRDREFTENVDVIVCTHAASLCELYMPFDKSMIIVVSTRYEIGRHSKKRWSTWNDNLQRIAAKKGNFIAANNLYDKYYIEHFTGIKNVLLLPSLATYVTSRAYTDIYSLDRRTEVLLAPARDVNPTIQESLETALHEYNVANEQHGATTREFTGATLEIVPIRSIYPRYEYRDLARHPAIVVIPYQVSFMTLFEFYRMSIPIFVPSPELMAQWHWDHRLLKERVWATVRGDAKGMQASAVEKYSGIFASSFSPLRGGMGSDKSDHRDHDPNNELSLESILAWVQHSDVYSWPHIHTFSSWTQLFSKLHGSVSAPSVGSKTTVNSSFARVDLKKTSRLMSLAMSKIEAETTYAWKMILSNLQRRKHLRKSRKKERDHDRRGNNGRIRGSNSYKIKQEGVSETGIGTTDVKEWTNFNRELRRRYGYELSPDDCDTTLYFD